MLLCDFNVVSTVIKGMRVVITDRGPHRHFFKVHFTGRSGYNHLALKRQFSSNGIEKKIPVITRYSNYSLYFLAVNLFFGCMTCLLRDLR